MAGVHYLSDGCRSNWGTTMQTNETPRYDASVNTTGCCPKFNPEGWDGQELHFTDKRFVKAATRSVMHVPMNMGSVFARVNKHIEDAGASDTDQFIVLSQDISSICSRFRKRSPARRWLR